MLCTSVLVVQTEMDVDVPTSSPDVKRQRVGENLNNVSGKVLPIMLRHDDSQRRKYTIDEIKTFLNEMGVMETSMMQDEGSINNYISSIRKNEDYLEFNINCHEKWLQKKDSTSVESLVVEGNNGKIDKSSIEVVSQSTEDLVSSHDIVADIFLPNHVNLELPEELSEVEVEVEDTDMDNDAPMNPVLSLTNVKLNALPFNIGTQQYIPDEDLRRSYRKK